MDVEIDVERRFEEMANIFGSILYFIKMRNTLKL